MHRFVGGDGLGHFERAAVFQVGRDARGAEGVAADRLQAQARALLLYRPLLSRRACPAVAATAGSHNDSCRSPGRSFRMKSAAFCACAAATTTSLASSRSFFSQPAM